MLTLSLPRPTPPAVGTPAPDFALPDLVGGGMVRLSDLSGKDALIVFLRGTWCPFCRDQMQQLSLQHARLEQAGITVVALVCQSADTVKAYVKDNPLPFPLLADARRDVARAWGVYYAVGPEGVNLAHPSLFILDRSGCITFSHVGANMRDWPLSVVLDRFLRLLEPEAPAVNGTGSQGTFAGLTPSNG